MISLRDASGEVAKNDDVDSSNIIANDDVIADVLTGDVIQNDVVEGSAKGNSIVTGEEAPLINGGFNCEGMMLCEEQVVETSEEAFFQVRGFKRLMVN